MEMNYGQTLDVIVKKNLLLITHFSAILLWNQYIFNKRDSNKSLKLKQKIKCKILV